MLLTLLVMICLVAKTFANWIVGDGATDILVENSIVENRSTNDFDKINVMWNETINESKKYWQFNITEFTGGSIGLVQELKSGYNIRGLFYEGSLSDGKNILVLDYGPQLTKGDILGIQLHINKPEIKVYFYHNDEYLGLAFNFKDYNLETLYPAVSFEGQGSVILIEQDVMPPVNLTEPPITIDSSYLLNNSHRNITGPWSLKKLICQNSNWDDIKFPNDTETALRLTHVKDEEYEAVLSVVNTIIFRLFKFNNEEWKTPSVRFATNIKTVHELYERWAVTFTDNPTKVQAVLKDHMAYLLWENDNCLGVFKRMNISPVSYSPFIEL